MEDPIPVTFRLEAVIRCPDCRRKSRAVMPVDTCQFFWDCPHCRGVIRPKEGDCCVFCSYADVPCPPVQAAGGNG